MFLMKARSTVQVPVQNCTSNMVTTVILLTALIALGQSAHINLHPAAPLSQDEVIALAEEVIAESGVAEKMATDDSGKAPINFAKVPRLQNSKIPTKQEIQASNSKFNFKREHQNEENIVPADGAVTAGETKNEPMSEDEMVFQWRALKLNKNNGHKYKVPITNDQDGETESPGNEASEELDEAGVVPGGKDLVVYNTLASVRGADRRAQGAADNGDGGDLQQKKGPFFRG